jgi:N-acetylglucosamine-6-sulfatase
VVRRILITLSLAAMLAVAVVALRGSGPSTPPTATVAGHHPNIVFILTDDLSWNLVNHRFAPHIVALQQRGETFDHYFVADSLCCPSRSTIFTGDFPHDTKVLSNTAPLGGFAKFQKERLARRTYAVALHGRGYRTGMLGKYLNGYGDPAMTPVTAPKPRGWDDWHVSNLSGYQEFNYVLNDNGTPNAYGGPSAACKPSPPHDDYGVDVLARDALDFVKRRTPFALEVATFAPHEPYTPAPRDACDFPGLHEPRDASFNAQNEHPPQWLGERRPLNAAQVARMDSDFRLRAQSVEAVDQLLARVESQLQREHELDDTYIVFSSDNGYHMGQHRLSVGKMTAFDTDIRVPLIVAGPGVPRGTTVHQVAQNVDLYPTFLQLAGARADTRVDGHSLVPLLHPSTHRWRTVALVEHRGKVTDPADPDFGDGKLGGDPTTYSAIRLSQSRLPHFHRPLEAVYVEYTDGEREFYDIRHDPYERDNIARALTVKQTRTLHRVLSQLESCHDARACWKAGQPETVS